MIFKEYERAVIFRLGIIETFDINKIKTIFPPICIILDFNIRVGLLLSGGARGPGVFFVIPCVDVYQKIDMRTQTYDVPPQEVNIIYIPFYSLVHKQFKKLKNTTLG